ncbi:MAG TPA: cytotoxic translational repressor of toxin-antitoxin stability system [Spirochaetota bacterium]|nr:cytotoxic translational repressor of toxin-antitoxin stability system [Spirochaetota bacterium]
MKEIIIIYSKESDKFLDKNQGIVNKKIINELLIKSLKKIFKDEIINIDLKALKGEYENFYRIRKGKIRIIFELKDDNTIVVNVIKIGFRGDVYND